MNIQVPEEIAEAVVAETAKHNGKPTRVEEGQGKREKKRGEREKDAALHRASSLLEAAARTTFSARDEARRRGDPDLELRCVDRMLAIAELRARIDIEDKA